MLYTVVVQWVEAAVAFYNTVGNGHAINSCNFYRIEGLTGRENIVKVLSALPVAAPPPPPPPPLLHRKRRSPSPRVHFVRPFLFKKKERSSSGHQPILRIHRPIRDNLKAWDEQRRRTFFFSLSLSSNPPTKGNMTGKEKRGGSGNKCEIGGGSVGIEASK